MSIKTVINTRGFDKFIRGLNGPSANVAAMYKQWGAVYRGYIRERWNDYSRGGGDWPPLKHREGSILRDTNTLFATVDYTFGDPGSRVEEIERDGIVVGFGGSGEHPEAQMTVARLAEIHDQGLGRVPKREILVADVPNRVMDRLVRIAHTQLRKQAQKSQV